MLSPDTGTPDPPLAPERMNDFDYVSADPALDDTFGYRCPVGSHIRRTNPRGAAVIAGGSTHRIVRRAMPYGPPFDPAQPDDAPRGLVGWFICADLANSFELIMSQWVNDSAFVRSVRGPDGANPVKNISGQDVLIGVNDPATSSFTLTVAAERGGAVEQPPADRLSAVRDHPRRRVLLPAEHHGAALPHRVSEPVATRRVPAVRAASLRGVRRLLALLLAVAVATGVAVAVGQEPSGDSADPASPAETAPPAPDVALPKQPAALAGALTATTRRLRAALGRWDGAGGVPRDVTYLALHHQRMLRLMAKRGALGDATLRRLPASVRGEAADTVRGLRRLAAIPRDLDNLPRLRVARAAPAADLRRFYGEGQRRFGVHWTVLASVNFVESAFGRVRSASEAGARGPMQFLPSTWRQYGMGGDIDDPHDAILGAANYLSRSGAREDLDRALFAYNHSRDYVRAIRAFASRMRAGEHAFLTYYSWQAYMRTKSGTRRLTGPGRAGAKPHRASAPAASDRVADLLRLGHAQREHRDAVDGDPRRQAAADGDDLRRQRAPEQLVETAPDDVGDGAERGRRDEDAQHRARGRAALQAAAELAPQVVRLAGGHRGAGDGGREDDAAGPERPEQRERDDDVDRRAWPRPGRSAATGAAARRTSASAAG